jgi:ketosteroid isomerase-like protein
MNPKELIVQWVKAFNDGDAERLSNFYSDEAVNHQVAESPIKGKGAAGK